MSTTSRENLVKRLTQERLGSYLAETGGSVPAAARKHHTKVITELSFGFWRHLCGTPYLTTLWVPALAAAFPHHPAPANPNRIRADMDDRMQRLHYLRNRIAHHEPIHQRNLEREHAEMLEIIRWICPDSHTWAESASRTPEILLERP